MFGRKKIKDPVEGTAEVLAMAPTAKAARQTGKLDVDHEIRLGVSLPGRAAYEADLTTQVPHAKTPWTGMTVPVNASQSDPARVEILWDRMEDAADRALRSGAAAEAGDASAAAEALGFKLKEDE